jgi:hypothetical protein
MHHSTYRNGALILALLSVFALMVLQYRPAATVETVGIATPYAPIDDYFDDEVTGSIAASATPRLALTGGQRLALTDEQRGFVFLGVINLPDIPDVDLPAPGIAEVVPETVKLRSMPAMVTRRIPELSGYRFVKLDDRILVVSARTRKVAAAIPRYKLMVR